MDSESEEDGMGVSCVRGECVDHDRVEGACDEREVLPVGLLTRPRSDRGWSCERVTEGSPGNTSVLRERSGEQVKGD